MYITSLLFISFGLLDPSMEEYLAIYTYIHIGELIYFNLSSGRL
jgi:hypothetical protein